MAEVRVEWVLQDRSTYQTLGTQTFFVSRIQSMHAAPHVGFVNRNGIEV